MSDVIGAMFLGEFQHTLDPKGRVILPSVFREQLKEGLVMTVGIDRCVEVHPAAAWPPFVQGLRDLKNTDARQRAFVRMILASAHPDTPDRQGRITVPARLREYARLDKDVAVVGNDARVELWNVESWTAYRDNALNDYAETAEALGAGKF